jgi:NAD+ synthase
MSILYDQSKKFNALVLGCGNKTEILLGYFTLYGDSGCSINSIGCLYKTQVWQLAKAIGIPKSIIDKRPSAGLWPGQTDEGELGMTYKEMDLISYYMVDKKLTPAQLIKKGFSKGSIDRIRGYINKSEFKRRAPSIARL